MSLWNRQQGASLAVASIAGLCALAVAYSRLGSSKVRLLKAPEPTEGKPYPWNLYDGGATLQTPYGRLRLYEMGPKEGQKVLLIHGISTPCTVWQRVIPKLIESGHRILCYDLVGRGYSDGMGHLNYDISLYVSQICMLLTSLPDWSGSFSIVGFSLGGVIATAFANYFPHRVDNLLLIAPAGLMHANSLSGFDRSFCLGRVSNSSVQSLLSFGIARSRFLVSNEEVDWQLGSHQGFQHAFASSLTSLIDKQELFQRVLDQFGDRMQTIWGDEDTTCPMEGARKIAGLKVHVIKGGQHSMIQQPQYSDQIAHLMTTFLSSPL